MPLVCIGKAKAVTATTRKFATLFYNAMFFGMTYQDPGVDHYEQKYLRARSERLAPQSC